MTRDFQHVSNGNLLSDAQQSVNDSFDPYVYTYDAWNRLVRGERVDRSECIRSGLPCQSSCAVRSANLIDREGRSRCSSSAVRLQRGVRRESPDRPFLARSNPLGSV